MLAEWPGCKLFQKLARARILVAAIATLLR
jgi:hypothetical protein